jgi:hypothetical protein
VALGLLAHVVGGGGVSLSCAPLIVATLGGVAATLVADRLAGYERTLSRGVVAMVGAGQLVMHLALSVSLMGDTSADTGTWGLSCRIVVAHAVAAGVLVALLLGVQRLLDVPLALLDRARAWLSTCLLISVGPCVEDSGISGVDVYAAAVAGVWIEPFVAKVLTRRGPPSAMSIA